MKRTPIKRKTPFRRKRPMRASSRTSTYAKRPRCTDFMMWVKKQPCALREVDPAGCFGRIEADHMGQRPMGQKADDLTCGPMCQQHHLERTSFSGFFKGWTRDMMRVWTTERIAYYQGLRVEELKRG